MRLLVLRHGKAAKPDSLKYPDDDRPLIDEGRERIAEVARQLQASGAVIDRIFASPYERTTETAQIVGGVLGVQVETEPLLALEGSVRSLLQKLWKMEEKTVLLVGHEPGLLDLLTTVSGKKGWILNPGDLVEISL